MTNLTRILLGAAVVVGGGVAVEGDWPVYGGDVMGSRYSRLAQIAPGNVSSMQVAWTYHTGEAGTPVGTDRAPQFEATPIVVDGTMYIGTPAGRVIALDPVTGTERWRTDATVDPKGHYGDPNNRGVAMWVDSTRAVGAPCRRRIFLAALDAQLIALDAATGHRCDGFGDGGRVDLTVGLRNPPEYKGEYEETSPPTVVNGVVVVGSAVADNNRQNAPSGVVRGFDARTGALKWSWDPVPQDSTDPAWKTWVGPHAHETGAANVWSVMAADPARDLVFLPTTSPSVDYYGGTRLGSNLYANSVVALRASTGKIVWHFQTVHHDLWDYDNASPPALVTIELHGKKIDAVLQATKTGQLFVLDRETGKPQFPVEERPVPASDVPGETASPTQPFTAGIAPLSPHRFTLDSAWGITPADREACRKEWAPLRNEGIFTPPSLGGTLQAPSNIGGAHWGGVAYDPARHIAVIPVNRLAAEVQLIPRAQHDFSSDEGDWEYARMAGTPYVMRRRISLGPSGLPCTPPPFGTLVAVDLSTGRHLWEVPLGAVKANLPPGSPLASLGSANLGGAIVTASGLVFIGASIDHRIHAYDSKTGRELWSGELPAGARATPMTYLGADGRQYVVIAAGGNDVWGPGDALVAFALPRH